MIRNYLKIAWRNLTKYKFISFINLFGLTVGLTCCLLILTYIFNELSFDKYNKMQTNIYRVKRTFLNPDNSDVTLSLSQLLRLLDYYLPMIFQRSENYKVLENGTTPLSYKDKLINEQNVFFADENLFDLFTVKVLKGNPKMH